MDQTEVTEVVDALVPVIEGAIARRMEEVYGVIEELREQFQQTINIMDGNDHAIIAAVQELRGQVTGEGYVVEEVVKRAAESWERFVRGEAEKLGMKVIMPKAQKIDPSLFSTGTADSDPKIESIEVR